jgi:hypothetical protein
MAAKLRLLNKKKHKPFDLKMSNGEEQCLLAMFWVSFF